MTAFIEAASPHVMNTYGRVPIALERGQGSRVWDVNGKQTWTHWAASPSTPWGTTTPGWCPRCKTSSAN